MMSGGLALWELIAIILGVLVAMVLLLACGYYCQSRLKSKKREETENTHARYVYKYDPVSGKGNVEVVLDNSNGAAGSNRASIDTQGTSGCRSHSGSIASHHSIAPVLTSSIPTRPSTLIEDNRPRSSSCSESKYVYRYNPSSGVGTVEKVLQSSSVSPRKGNVTKDSYSSLAMGLLERPFRSRTGSGGSGGSGPGERGSVGEVTSSLERIQERRRLKHGQKSMSQMILYQRSPDHFRSVPQRGLQESGFVPTHRQSHDVTFGQGFPSRHDRSRSSFQRQSHDLVFPAHKNIKNKHLREQQRHSNPSVLQIIQSGLSHSTSEISNLIRHKQRGSTDSTPEQSKILASTPPHKHPHRQLTHRSSDGRIFNNESRHLLSPHHLKTADPDSYRTLSLTDLTHDLWQAEYSSSSKRKRLNSSNTSTPTTSNTPPSAGLLGSSLPGNPAHNNEHKKSASELNLSTTPIHTTEAQIHTPRAVLHRSSFSVIDESTLKSHTSLAHQEGQDIAKGDHPTDSVHLQTSPLSVPDQLLKAPNPLRLPPSYDSIFGQ